MNGADDIKHLLKSHILAEYLPGESPENLTNDTPLRTSGILDSIATVKLVSFIEATFAIELEAHETGIQNFDRIEDIAALIARKRAGR
jgi:acyl carrier protein